MKHGVGTIKSKLTPAVHFVKRPCPLYKYLRKYPEWTFGVKSHKVTMMTSYLLQKRVRSQRERTRNPRRARSLRDAEQASGEIVRHEAHDVRRMMQHVVHRLAIHVQDPTGVSAHVHEHNQLVSHGALGHRFLVGVAVVDTEITSQDSIRPIMIGLQGNKAHRTPPSCVRLHSSQKLSQTKLGGQVTPQNLSSLDISRQPW